MYHYHHYYHYYHLVVRILALLRGLGDVLVQGGDARLERLYMYYYQYCHYYY